MGKFDNWGYPMCDECGMPAANTCNPCANTCNTGCEETCAAPAAPCNTPCNTPCAVGNGETHVYFETCDGIKEITHNCECHNDENAGRVLDVNVKLCNVCPGRSSAVGVHLWELDANGNEYARGFRAVTVPAHNANANRDLALPTQRFILPENGSCTGRRHFVVRTTNHYVDQPTNCGW